MKSLTFAVTGISLGLFSATSTALSLATIDVAMSQDQCLAIAASHLRQIPTQPPGGLFDFGETVSFNDNEGAIAVSCRADRGVVFLVVSSGSSQKYETAFDELGATYRLESAGPSPANASPNQQPKPTPYRRGLP